MTLDDKVMWTWSLPLVEERGSAVDSSRPQDSGRRTGEMTLGPTSVGTGQTFGKRPFLVRMKGEFLQHDTQYLIEAISCPQGPFFPAIPNTYTKYNCMQCWGNEGRYLPENILKHSEDGNDNSICETAKETQM